MCVYLKKYLKSQNTASFLLQAPNYPDPGRCWDIVDKYKVSIFYTAPTLVRSLMREGNEVCHGSNLIFLNVGGFSLKSGGYKKIWQCNNT